MITETLTALPPEQAIERARSFFSDPGAALPATVIESDDNHLTVATFRSRLAITAYPDPDGQGTRVRVSTLRNNDAVGKLLTLLASADPDGGASS